MYTIPGHHHISMITKNANDNNYFYREVLGLRRVKVTVNQDDPSMYHLFYGDKTGSPGTELSFFEIPLVGRTHRGTNAITKIGLIVPSEESLHYWQKRLNEFSVANEGITTFANRPALLFEDKEGLRMALIAGYGNKIDHWETYEKSPIPTEHQILGMGTVEITVKNLSKLTATLTELFGYTAIEQTENTKLFQSVAGEMFGEIYAIKQDGPSEKPGRGSIHHLAIRVKNDEELNFWNEQVKKRGFQTSGIVDRYYFKSLYFRESNGILFEIATDGPGFLRDGDIETLGEQLDLPDFLEVRREEIMTKLKPID
ncbi:ring-cleaving dioxygenase [Solibacillus sp. FSL R7-0682]|uniref:ring-cleaving dioxygenase n=1 Tax=Solibacillus sp. FSL R7-0682 TaxID=2921690 RepID=UPI0030F6E260